MATPIVKSDTEPKTTFVNCSNRSCSNEVEVPEDFEFKGCCSGNMCGCAGLEINPVFCKECA